MSGDTGVCTISQSKLQCNKSDKSIFSSTALNPEDCNMSTVAELRICTTDAVKRKVPDNWQPDIVGLGSFRSKLLKLKATKNLFNFRYRIYF